MTIINRRRVSSYTVSDADAATYLAALATADGTTPAAGVQSAVDTYFQALKSNSLWSLINQIFLMCGPVSLAGALTAAKGTNPTSFNFAAGDYNQKLGLGASSNSTKYLSMNTAGSSITTTSHHFSVTCSGGMETTGDRIACGSYNGSTGASLLTLDVYGTGVGRAFRSGTFTTNQYPNITTGLGTSGYLCGSRTASNAAFVDYNGTTASNTSSVSPSFITGSPFVFAINQNGTAAGFTSMVCQIFTRGSGLTTAQSVTLRSLNNAYIAAIAAL